MPKRNESKEPTRPRPVEDPGEPKDQESDTEGHSFILDPELNRALARQREKDIQRDLKQESRRPFFRRGR